MGAWATDSFANDDALDWLLDFVETPTIEMLRDTLEHITTMDADEYLEAPDCSEAVAAAEIVAALHGRPSAKLPDDLRDWLQTDHGLKAGSLIHTAADAMKRIMQNSELQELWDDSDSSAGWLDDMAGLIRRLS
ncbi:MAG: DUF4259 domain-containing protein [Alphaproteobacteria bacterium]|nr:DUF4259 domain-containing protein [Alphaproteobacteria bacterium]